MGRWEFFFRLTGRTNDLKGKTYFLFTGRTNTTCTSRNRYANIHVNLHVSPCLLHPRVVSNCASFQITRVWENRDGRLLYRGWSRLCLHAASLNFAEGASAAVTAAARIARTEAINKEGAVALAAAEQVEGEELLRRKTRAARIVSQDKYRSMTGLREMQLATPGRMSSIASSVLRCASSIHVLLMELHVSRV